jgi:GNAT superfamily N-acetyltransferase
MTSADVDAASRLIVGVFDEAIAPLYTEQGVREFLAYADPAAMAARLTDGHFGLLAFAGDDLVGVTEVRQSSHLAMFFVATDRQRSGLGRELMRRTLEVCRTERPELVSFSVNSSPNSVTAYQRFGFVATGTERTEHGIRFIPMVLDLRPDSGRSA